MNNEIFKKTGKIRNPGRNPGFSDKTFYYITLSRFRRKMSPAGTVTRSFDLSAV